MDAGLPVLPLYGLLALALGTLAPRVLQPLLAAVLVLGAFALAVPEPVRSGAVQRWLEARYDGSGVERLADPAGIIVLGGGLATYVVDAHFGNSLDERGRSGRITGAAALANRFPKARVIHTGREQASASDAFATLGVARERIVVEDRSTTTYENARFSADLLRPQPGQRWILVTSASHMPRAMATFRSAGFDVDPSRAPPPAAAWAAQNGWPRGRRELLSILGYVVTGRILPWRLLG